MQRSGQNYIGTGRVLGQLSSSCNLYRELPFLWHLWL